MIQKPLVSIVTPSYNQAPYLGFSLNSVLQQDYARIEYLVVDGGSTDGSVELIEAQADSFTWWVSEKDSGQAEAINKGFQRATGEIVAWLNSDDLYLPGAVKKAVSAFQSNPDLGMVYGNAITIDQNGSLLNTLAFPDWDFDDLLAFRIICQPAVFMRREILEKAGHLSQHLHYMLDHELWLRVARLAPIQHIPDFLAAARHHPTAKNVSQAPGFGKETMQLLARIKSDPQYAPFLESSHPGLGMRKIEAGAYRLNARYLLDGGFYADSLRWYARAFRQDPRYTMAHWHRILYAAMNLIKMQNLSNRMLAVQQSRQKSRLPHAAIFHCLPGLARHPMTAQQPVLVTGAHRSGTTWVGRMLDAGGETAYISEPLNILHRRGVFRPPTHHWYTYINQENEQDYLDGFIETLTFRYHILLEMQSLRSFKDLARMGRDSQVFLKGKIAKKRPLLKDPFAVFSAPWFRERLGCTVVIVIRHPAAFTSSLKRLGWEFDFSHLLSQPLLIRDWLEPYRQDMERLLPTQVNDDNTLILQASLLWRMVYETVSGFQPDNPSEHFRTEHFRTIVRHEDLSLDPVNGFRQLYHNLGLAFNHRAEESVVSSSRSSNPRERSRKAVHTVRLDSSANLDNWKRRLSTDEIGLIRGRTEDIASKYYPDISWE